MYLYSEQGKSRLPPQAAMQAAIEKQQEAAARCYVASARHTLQEDYMAYMDQLALDVGCSPKLSKHNC